MKQRGKREALDHMSGLQAQGRARQAPRGRLPLVFTQLCSPAILLGSRAVYTLTNTRATGTEPRPPYTVRLH